MIRRWYYFRYIYSSHAPSLSFSLLTLPLLSLTLLSLHFKLSLLLLLLFESFLSLHLFLLPAVLCLLELESLAFLFLNLQQAETLLGLLLLFYLLFEISFEFFGDLWDLWAFLGILSGFEILVGDLFMGLIVEI